MCSIPSPVIGRGFRVRDNCAARLSGAPHVSQSFSFDPSRHGFQCIRDALKNLVDLALGLDSRARWIGSLELSVRTRLTGGRPINQQALAGSGAAAPLGLEPGLLTAR